MAIKIKTGVVQQTTQLFREFHLREVTFEEAVEFVRKYKPPPQSENPAISLGEAFGTSGKWSAGVNWWEPKKIVEGE